MGCPIELNASIGGRGGRKFASVGRRSFNTDEILFKCVKYERVNRSKFLYILNLIDFVKNQYCLEKKMSERLVVSGNTR